MLDQIDPILLRLIFEHKNGLVIVGHRNVLPQCALQTVCSRILLSLNLYLKYRVVIDHVDLVINSRMHHYLKHSICAKCILSHLSAFYVNLYDTSQPFVTCENTNDHVLGRSEGKTIPFVIISFSVPKQVPRNRARLLLCQVQE